MSRGLTPEQVESERIYRAVIELQARDIPRADWPEDLRNKGVYCPAHLIEAPGGVDAAVSNHIRSLGSEAVFF